MAVMKQKIASGDERKTAEDFARDAMEGLRRMHGHPSASKGPIIARFSRNAIGTSLSLRSLLEERMTCMRDSDVFTDNTDDTFAAPISSLAELEAQLVGTGAILRQYSGLPAAWSRFLAMHISEYH